MASNAERFAVDSSVSVAALDPGHVAHASASRDVREHRPVLAGHAAFETFSVLTRLPGDARVPPAIAIEVIRATFGEPCWLSADSQQRLLERVGALGMVGGAVYDALVAAASLDAGRTLLTRDRRAQSTYAAVGVQTKFVS